MANYMSEFYTEFYTVYLLNLSSIYDLIQQHARKALLHYIFHYIFHTNTARQITYE